MAEKDELTPTPTSALDTKAIEPTTNLSMTDASFSWMPGEESPLVLQDVNLRLQMGKIHMVVGPVASVCGILSG